MAEFEVRCNLQIAQHPEPSEQHEIAEFYELVKPKGCWEVRDAANLAVKSVCLGLAGCRLISEVVDPDTKRPLPEEEVWGVPPRD